MDKYKELYEFSLNVYKEQITRDNNLQEKASKYFTALTFILGFSVYYFKWFFEQDISKFIVMDWIIIITSFILIFIIYLTWDKILKVLRVENYAAIPLRDDVLDFYYDNKLIDIYYAMSKGLNNAVKINTKVHDTKSEYLSKAYNYLKIDSFLILLLLILNVIKLFIK